MSKVELQNFAKQLRKNILFAAFSAGAKSAHIGGALSIVEIVATLYGKIMNVNSKNPLDPNRDRFILSKGHACFSYLFSFAEKGYFKRDELKKF